VHELSIAMSIIEMAEEEAARRDAVVEAVHVDLGRLSGVVADALLFSYEIACAGTRLEGSRLVITEVPIEVFCPTCKAQKILSSMQWFCCPGCGTPTPNVIRGKEMNVTALEIRDECPAAPAGSA